jgi:hypothetical protein
MSIDWLSKLLPLLFIVVAVVALVGIARFGLKGSLFGARIAHTIGEARGARQRVGSLVLRVHVLERGSPDRAIGIEVVGRTPLSYQMLPISLSAEETRNLISMLQQAVAEAA